MKLKDGSTKDEHRLIMEKILGRKLNFNEVVHHKDENKRNNSPDNLELKTRSKHSQDHFKPILITSEQKAKMKIKLSESYRGENAPWSILTGEQVILIKRLLKANTMKMVDIAAKFNVDRRTIGDIKHRRSWMHINIE